MREATAGLAESQCDSNPSVLELESYLKDVAKLNLRIEVRILSPRADMVIIAKLRGSDVLELLEYGGSSSVGWIEKVDESGKYGHIPEYWRFGRNERPPIDSNVNYKYLLKYYTPDDFLDTETLYQIALRRGTCVDGQSCVYAKNYVARKLSAVYEFLLNSVDKDRTSGARWPVLEDQASWTKLDIIGDVDVGVKLPVNKAILVRVYAEGYDPLELEPDSGAVPSDEQLRWETKGETEYEVEGEDVPIPNSNLFIDYTVGALLERYASYVGLARL
jgi:hypothetical protein